MKKILIIDDSALMRRVLSDIINSDKRFTVSGVAMNGLEAYQMITSKGADYDVALVDINMPVMDGLQLLQKLKETGINLTCVMVSTLVKEGAKETIKALELGAFDFVEKPDNPIEIRSGSFRNKILRTLEVAAKEEVPNTDTKRGGGIFGQFRKKKLTENASTSKLVAIACSTGGPKALQSIIPQLPANLDAGVLIVQHMPEGFTKSLSERLNELSKVHVKEVEDGDVIEKGKVYIAKGGSQMRLVKTSSGGHKLSVTTGEVRNGLKPCADIMYESLVNAPYDEITCVVLTGMGSDGTKGIQELSKSNCVYVIAQDEQTCTVYGMPKVITETGLVDEVVSLHQVASAIQKKVGCH